MDEQVLYQLSDANCDTIFYGIESGSDEVLEKINKRFTAAEALDVVQQSLQYMKVHVSLMWGFPFESIDEALAATPQWPKTRNQKARPATPTALPEGGMQ